MGGGVASVCVGIDFEAICFGSCTNPLASSLTRACRQACLPLTNHVKVSPIRFGQARGLGMTRRFLAVIAHIVFASRLR